MWVGLHFDKLFTKGQLRRSRFRTNRDQGQQGDNLAVIAVGAARCPPYPPWFAPGPSGFPV